MLTSATSATTTSFGTLTGVRVLLLARAGVRSRSTQDVAEQHLIDHGPRVIARVETEHRLQQIELTGAIACSQLVAQRTGGQCTDATVAREAAHHVVALGVVLQHDAVDAGREEEAAIGRSGHRSDGGRVPFEYGEFECVARVPQDHATVVAAAHHALAVGRERTRHDGVGVRTQRGHLLEGATRIPQLERVILAAGHQAPTVARELTAAHRGAMSVDGAQQSAAMVVPHADQLVLAGAHHQRKMWMCTDRRHNARVSIHAAQLGFLACVPHLQCAVTRSTNHRLTLICECTGGHIRAMTTETTHYRTSLNIPNHQSFIS
mmetsp:Transcript_11660/g.29462  ORF Transcript_11660/g.29462 Transcript_11660/m.29462 type:complete len:320 (+) Transcript_11660:159-1118(+)